MPGPDRAPLPEGWQTQLVDMIRGAIPPDPAWLGGGVGLSPTQQLAVYQEQYTLRMASALRQNYPGLCAWRGPCSEHALVTALREDPPRSWTLERVGLGLPEWLARHGAAPAEVELAQVDRAVTLGFSAADTRPLDPGALGPDTPLALGPHVSLLRLTHSVHRWRAQALSGQPPDPLEPGAFSVVVYRHEDRMKHLEVHPTALLLLEALDGRALLQALPEALARGADAAELGAHVGAWLATFTARGVVGAGATGLGNQREHPGRERRE